MSETDSMARFDGPQSVFFKGASILPHGFEVEEGGKFFAQGASHQSSIKAAIAPLRTNDLTDHSVFRDVGRGPSQDDFTPSHLFTSTVSIIEPDINGLAKPTLSNGNGNGNGGNGNGGGGKGKPDRGPATSDPIKVDETPITETTPITDTAPAPQIQTADYVSGLDTPDGYNIELMFSGTWSDAGKNAAYAAAETISDIVTGDVPAYNGIDDIRITLTSAEIDGAGGTWGKGGYDILRSDSKLAATGHVTIDAADAPTALKMGLLEDLLMHEMLHAMGFGTAWNVMGLVDSYNGDLRFNGAHATQVYNSLYASLASKDALSAKGVPIETDGGSGSAGKHWDEATFGEEIMSTNLNYSNTTTPLTIAALEDMGYQTTITDEFLFV